MDIQTPRTAVLKHPIFNSALPHPLAQVAGGVITLVIGTVNSPALKKPKNPRDDYILYQSQDVWRDR